MSCNRSSLTKSGDAGQDLIGGFGPNERLGGFVIDAQIVANRLFQFASTAVNAASDLLVCQQSEKTLDHVDPRGSRGREVQVVARSFRQPAADQRRLVRTVVVQDQMHLQSGRHGSIDGIKELAELDRTMAAMQSAQDLARFGIQGGKQRRRAVTEVVVTAPLYLAGTHGQNRLAPIQRLNLRLFVHTQHQRPLGRIQVQAHDVPHLLHELRVGGQLESLAAMRLQPESLPDALNGHVTESAGFGHRTRRPVRGVAGCRLQRAHDHGIDFVVFDAARCSAAWLIEQSAYPVTHKPVAPLAHHLIADTPPQSHRRVRHAAGATGMG